MIMATEYRLSYTGSEINQKLGAIDNAVLYTEQTLTEKQKAQARENIGVGFTHTTIEHAPFGEELASANGWTADGWTGDFENGFTHTSGNTSPLVFAMPEYTGTNIYRVSFKTNDSIKSDSLKISLGNSEPLEVYGQSDGADEEIIIGIRSVSNGNLQFLPSTSFTNTIYDVSIAKVVGVLEGVEQIIDSDGEISYEVRPTRAIDNNVFIGKNSGQNSIGSFGNVGVGADALKQNTSGFWNIGIGHNALKTNTTGSRNIAIGYIALQDNVSGTRNVSIGSFALHSNTHGKDSVAIGADALNSQTTGGTNIGIGRSALHFNTTGTQNVAIGVQALQNNTQSNNTAVGTFALQKTTTGSSNVGLGYSAGINITTGSNNLAVGTNALYKLKTGNDNIGIGLQAGRGQNVTTGFNNCLFFGTQAGYSLGDGANYNIFIGYRAGYSATSGIRNIMIGANTDVPTPTQSDWLNIGNLIEGSMATDGSAFARVNGTLELTNLATSDPGIAGRLWNDNGTLKVSQG